MHPPSCSLGQYQVLSFAFTSLIFCSFFCLCLTEVNHYVLMCVLLSVFILIFLTIFTEPEPNFVSLLIELWAVSRQIELQFVELSYPSVNFALSLLNQLRLRI